MNRFLVLKKKLHSLSAHYYHKDEYIFVLQGVPGVVGKKRNRILGHVTDDGEL